MAVEKKSTYRGLTPAQVEAHKNYMKNHNYVEIKVRVTKEQRAAIQEHASAMGESATAFINRAINEQMIRDNSQN